MPHQQLTAEKVYVLQNPAAFEVVVVTRNGQERHYLAPAGQFRPPCKAAVIGSGELEAVQVESVRPVTLADLRVPYSYKWAYHHHGVTAAWLSATVDAELASRDVDVELQRLSDLYRLSRFDDLRAPDPARPARTLGRVLDLETAYIEKVVGSESEEACRLEVPALAASLYGALADTDWPSDPKSRRAFEALRRLRDFDPETSTARAALEQALRILRGETVDPKPRSLAAEVSAVVQDLQSLDLERTTNQDCWERAGQVELRLRDALDECESDDDLAAVVKSAADDLAFYRSRGNVQNACAELRSLTELLLAFRSDVPEAQSVAAFARWVQAEPVDGLPRTGGVTPAPTGRRQYRSTAAIQEELRAFPPDRPTDLADAVEAAKVVSSDRFQVSVSKVVVHVGSPYVRIDLRERSVDACVLSTAVWTQAVWAPDADGIRAVLGDRLDPACTDAVVRFLLDRIYKTAPAFQEGDVQIAAAGPTEKPRVYRQVWGDETVKLRLTDGAVVSVPYRLLRSLMYAERTPGLGLPSRYSEAVLTALDAFNGNRPVEICMACGFPFVWVTLQNGRVFGTLPSRVRAWVAAAALGRGHDSQTSASVEAIDAEAVVRFLNRAFEDDDADVLPQRDPELPGVDPGSFKASLLSWSETGLSVTLASSSGTRTVRLPHGWVKEAVVRPRSRALSGRWELLAEDAAVCYDAVYKALGPGLGLKVQKVVVVAGVATVHMADAGSFAMDEGAFVEVVRTVLADAGVVEVDAALSLAEMHALVEFVTERLAPSPSDRGKALRTPYPEPVPGRQVWNPEDLWLHLPGFGVRLVPYGVLWRMAHRPDEAMASSTPDDLRAAVHEALRRYLPATV